VWTDLVGVIRLRRPSCYCERCQLGSTPLDAALELTERCQQPDVRKAAVQLTKALLYETACELLGALRVAYGTSSTVQTTPESLWNRTLFRAFLPPSVGKIRSGRSTECLRAVSGSRS
jgi:hypothetical protein